MRARVERRAWRSTQRRTPATSVARAPRQRMTSARRGCTAPVDEHDACGVGFVAHIKGHRSHAIVRHALDLLINLEHRGACGSDPDTGDGAGILVQMPDRFLRQRLPFCPAAGRCLRRRAGVPAPRGRGARAAARRSSSASPAKKDSRCSAGARCRPTSPPSAATPPRLRRSSSRCSSAGAAGARRTPTPDARFERTLYVIRKRIEHAVAASSAAGPRPPAPSTSSACRPRRSSTRAC